MRTQFPAAACRARGVLCPFYVLLALCILGAVRPAAAQWTAADAQAAFSDYNNAFYFNAGGANYDYRLNQGSTTSTTGFWTDAEEIELAIDAYNQNPTSANATIVNQLCNGFVALYGSDWSGDSYDDDLMWATIAFVRAYKAIGATQWLSDAETNFNTVWSRGYDTTFGGGIWWNAAQANTSSGYKNSAANWTFVIAGNLLYQATSNATYLTEANTIYTWAYNNLYVPSTGEIYDGINSSGIQSGQYSYNYGVSIGADYFENHYSDATNAANYLMNHVSGGTVGGYDILPNYGQGGTDGSGFNGITLRWVGYAYANGAISNPQVLAWAQTNVSLAWAQRNSSGLSWNNWFAFTPPSGLYSWDCSNTVVGLLDIPVTSTGPGFSVAASPASIQVSPGNSGTTAIVVTPLNDFTGTIDLTATVIGSPTGVTASLSQSSLPGAGSVTLTVATTSATLGGNYLVAVTGTSGNLAQTAFIQVGLPFFTLSVAPPGIYLNQSASATTAVTITPQNGFNQKVQFAPLSGLPDGVTASFTPSTTTASTKLTLAASNRAITTPSTPVTITASSPGYSQTAAATLAVSAALAGSGGGVPVNLSAAYNLTGIYPSGTVYTTGGLDGLGYSYASNLLTGARALSGVVFQFGPTAKPDAVYGAGQTIPLPSGSFTTLQLLATGINGEQSEQTVTVKYTDGTTSQFTQNFSDWFSPSYNTNESEAVAMPYRNAANGTQQNAQFNLYGYTFVLQPGKVVKSLTLPNNRNVIVLAATLTDQQLGAPVNLSSAFNVTGIYTDGVTFPSNGGLDGGGEAYSATLLGDTSGSALVVAGGAEFQIGAPDVVDAVYGDGTAIALPPGHFATLHMLGTGVGGNQTAQPVVVTYTDGSSSTFTQSFSDWFSPQEYPGESIAVKSAYRNNSNGTEQQVAFNLYEYTFPLDRAKSVQSITLPNNRHVLALAVTLTRGPE